MRSLALIVKKLVLTLGFVFSTLCTAFGQEMDIEPNDTCPTAQEVGAVTLPFRVDGMLDSANVDFFRLALTPNSLVRVDLEGEPTGNGTLPDPFLGLFDSECNVIAIDDDGSGSSPNSRLTFTVPSDGIFVLAATSCCDDAFSGAGVSNGTYQLTVTPGPPPAGPISGRIVDSDTGEPFPGDSPPFAFVDLNRCSDGECSELVNSQSTDSEGRFRFELDFNGNDLTAGTYQLNASADQFESAQTELFELGAGEDLDVGDIALIPPAILFNNIRACENLPTRGGTCDYSVTINNRTSTQFSGSVWSIVNASGTGAFNDFTTFQTGVSGAGFPQPQRVNLAPGESRVVNFKFEVPFTVASGASICADVFAGQGRQNAQFDTVTHRFLFCISKDNASGFTMVPAEEARSKQFRQQFEQPMRRSR